MSHDPKEQRKRESRQEKFMIELLNRPENKTCADCCAPKPEWASVNLGCLLCIRCAGLHRKLGVTVSKIKSVDLDLWQDDWLEKVSSMGNARINAIYFATNKPARIDNDDESMSVFIHNKYVKMLYSKMGPAQKASNTHQGHHQQQNYPQLQQYAENSMNRPEMNQNTERWVAEITQMQSMGFEKSKVVQALNRYNGNIQNAVESLLSSPRSSTPPQLPFRQEQDLSRQTVNAQFQRPSPTYGQTKAFVQPQMQVQPAQVSNQRTSPQQNAATGELLDIFSQPTQQANSQSLVNQYHGSQQQQYQQWSPNNLQQAQHQSFALNQVQLQYPSYNPIQQSAAPLGNQSQQYNSARSDTSSQYNSSPQQIPSQYPSNQAFPPQYNRPLQFATPSQQTTSNQFLNYPSNPSNPILQNQSPAPSTDANTVQKQPATINQTAFSYGPVQPPTMQNNISFQQESNFNQARQPEWNERVQPFQGNMFDTQNAPESQIPPPNPVKYKQDILSLFHAPPVQQQQQMNNYTQFSNSQQQQQYFPQPQMMNNQVNFQPQMNPYPTNQFQYSRVETRQQQYALLTRPQDQTGDIFKQSSTPVPQQQKQPDNLFSEFKMFK